MRNGRVRRAKPTVFYLFHWTLFFLLFFVKCAKKQQQQHARNAMWSSFDSHFFSVIIFCVLIDWSGKHYRTSVCGVQFPRGNESREGDSGEGIGPLEHADDLRADIFHTFHTHDMIKLELEMSSSKWQTTRYVDRYIHTYIHLCICQIHGQLSLDIASAVPLSPLPPFHQAKCNLWPQHFQMNLKIIFLFAVEIVPIILKIEHNDCLPLSPYSLPLCLC